MNQITLTIPRDHAPALLYLLERGMEAAEAETLSPLSFDRAQAVRELIEEQIAEAVING